MSASGGFVIVVAVVERCLLLLGLDLKNVFVEAFDETATAEVSFRRRDSNFFEKFEETAKEEVLQSNSLPIYSFGGSYVV